MKMDKTDMITAADTFLAVLEQARINAAADCDAEMCQDLANQIAGALSVLCITGLISPAERTRRHEAMCQDYMDAVFRGAAE